MDAQGRGQWLFLTALVSVTLLGPLTIHMFLPAMPAIQHDLNVSLAVIQAGLSLAVATLAATTIVYGTLSDRYGRKPVLIGGLVLFMIGVAVSAVAPDASVLLAGRVIQAAGAGCGIVIARAMVRDTYGDEKLTKYFAYLTTAYVLGPMLGPLLAGVLVDLYGWRSLFVLALAAALAITAATVFAIRETHTRRSRFQGMRALLRDYGFLLKSARFTGYTLHTGFSTGGFYALISASAFLVVDVLGEAAGTFGLYFIVLPLGFMAGNFVSGRFSARIGNERMVILGSVLAMAAVLAHAALLFAVPMSVEALLLPGGVLTFFQGLTMPNAQAGAIQTEPRLTGTASGLLVFLQMGTAGAFSQLIGLWSDRTFVPMVVLMGLGIFLSLVTGWFGARGRPQASSM